MADVKDKLVSLEGLKAVTDGINDMTTGINLLRGTRDFRQGVGRLKSLPTWNYKDGFMLGSYGAVSNEDGEFSICYADRPGASTSTVTDIYSSVIEDGLNVGDVYTYSLEVRIDDDSVVSAAKNTVIGAIRCLNNVPTVIAYINITLGDLGTDITIGKWYKVKKTITVVSGTVVMNANIRFVGDKTMSVRKLKLEKGSINNPIWSPSPFDIDYINDETTVINLLRGTRDFTLGNIADSSNPLYYTDGFKNQSNYTLSKDEQDFGVATKSGSGSFGFYGSLVNAENIKELTLFADIKLTDADTLKASQSCIGLTYFEEDSPTTPRTLKSLSLGEAFNNNLINDEWRTIVLHASVPSSASRILAAFNKYDGAGSVSYRKCGLYEGHINHPIWSASPFDVAQESALYPSVNLGSNVNRINQGDNLDDFTTPGTYACYNSADTSGISNCPTTFAFKLYVDKATGSNNTGGDENRYIRQTLVIFSSDATVYIRYNNEHTVNWTPWRQTYANTTVRPIEAGGTNATTATKALSNLGAMPLAGGTFTGAVKNTIGHYTHIAQGTAGQQGYVNIARITAKTGYINSPIYFKLFSRARNTECDLWIRLNNAATVDTMKVDVAYYIGTTFNVVVHKAATGVWDVYVKKFEGYDVISVADSYWYTSVITPTAGTIEWLNVHADEPPTSDIVQATPAPMDIIASSAATLTGTLSIANGGTGATSANEALDNLFVVASIPEWGDTTFEDTQGYFPFLNSNTGTGQHHVVKRAPSKVWTWIVSKIRSVFGFSSSNVLSAANGGTGTTTLDNFVQYLGTNPITSNSQDVRDKWTNSPIGVYYFSNNNVLTGSPDAYGSLLNMHTPNGSVIQQLFLSNSGDAYVRRFNGSYTEKIPFERLAKASEIPTVQKGTVSINPKSSGTATVTFSPAFSSAPVVVCTPEGGQAALYINQKTASGFTINMVENVSTSTQAFTVDWVAYA